MSTAGTSYTLYLIGMGPGAAEWVSTGAWDRIRQTPHLFASARIRHLVERTLPAGDLAGKSWYLLDGRLTAVLPELETALRGADAAVLCTGDTGLFSVANWLSQQIRRRLPDQPLRVMPGISSLQYFCGRLNRRWDDLAIISLHGRQPDAFDAAAVSGRPLMIFTDDRCDPVWIANRLTALGRPDAAMTCGYQLSYPEEEVVSGTAADIVGWPPRPEALCLVLVEGEQRAGTHAARQGPGFAGGLPDEAFVRGKRPMTKSNIRSRLASLLDVRGDECCWDVGAGTGSCTVEMALLCPAGRVSAIEREAEGVRLLQENCRRFGLSHVDIVEGEAPAALAGLPLPDRVFIGGSGGQLGPILEALDRLWQTGPPADSAGTGRGRRLIISAVTPETPAQVLALLPQYHFRLTVMEQIQATAYRAVGRVHMPSTDHPVWLMAADWEGPASAEADRQNRSSR